jgi:hypothetical protein
MVEHEPNRSSGGQTSLTEIGHPSSWKQEARTRGTFALIGTLIDD